MKRKRKKIYLWNHALLSAQRPNGDDGNQKWALSEAELYNDGISKLFYRPGPYKDFFFAFWVPVGSLLFFHSVGSLFGKIDFLFPAKKLDFINVVLGPYLTLTLGLWTFGLEERLNFWIFFWERSHKPWVQVRFGCVELALRADWKWVSNADNWVWQMQNGWTRLVSA